MGGMIAQHLALEDRASIRSLTLACTTPGGRAAPNWRLMTTAALRPVLGSKRTFPLVAPALYAKDTLKERRERVQQDFERRMEDNTSPLTLWAQMGAIAGHDTRARLSELQGIPTLVVHGLEDNLVPSDRGRELGGLDPRRAAGAGAQVRAPAHHRRRGSGGGRDPRAPRSGTRGTRSPNPREPGYAA